MSEVSIRAALEKRLNAMAPAIATALENVQFTPPAEDVPYQMVHLMRAEPENPEMGVTFSRSLGVFQVTLLYPRTKGPGVAEARAEAIKQWFPRGLTLTQGGVQVIIDRTPYVMPGFADGDRWAVPVRIQYFSNLTS